MRVTWLAPWIGIAVVAAAAATSAAACADDGGRVTLADLDLAAYVRDVQPIMEARCGTLDCHGNAGRALRLYAETGLRQRAELRDLPITEAELAANVASLAGVDPEHRGAASLVITKPLADAIGHVGGDVWLRADEPQVVCVVAWLTGASDDAAAQAACALAADEVALPE